MAEYIDRNQTQAYLHNNMMWYNEDGYIADDSEIDKALWDLINGVPTADVVKREMILDFIEDNRPTDVQTDWERGCAYICDEIEKLLM